jgi:hypothetical protein
MIHFKHRLPTTEEINSLKQYCLTQGDSKVDIVEQDIPKLSYFDPSDLHDTNVKGKHANLVFHSVTVVMNNANDINQLNKDSFYRKALPAKTDY